LSKVLPLNSCNSQIERIDSLEEKKILNGKKAFFQKKEGIRKDLSFFFGVKKSLLKIKDLQIVFTVGACLGWTKICEDPEKKSERFQKRS